MKSFRLFFPVLAIACIMVSCNSDLEEEVFSEEITSAIEKIETLFKEGDVKNEFSYVEGAEKIETPLPMDAKLEYISNNLLIETRAYGGSCLIIKDPNSSCPMGSNMLEFHMDCEDSGGNSSLRGGSWHGDTFVSSQGNMIFKFCIVASSNFTKAGSSSGTYAVLSSATTSDYHFKRLFDCEDNSTNNKYYLNGVQISKTTVNSSPWGIQEDNSGNITFSFVFVTTPWPNFISGAPPTHITHQYGLFGGTGTGTRSGLIHTDDEDKNNKNSYTEYMPGASAPKTYISKIFTEYGKNSIMKVTKIK